MRPTRLEIEEVHLWVKVKPAKAWAKIKITCPRQL